MADQNEIEFKVRVTDAGLPKLAENLDKVDSKTRQLGGAAARTGDDIAEVGRDAGVAAGGLDDLQENLDKVDSKTRQLGGTAARTGDDIAGVGRDAGVAAGGLDDLQRQVLLIRNAFVALQGGGYLAGLIKDVATTADEYNNLAGRIRLVTGEGEAFERAFERVQQVAIDTNSSLEGTGDLFARLTEAGKSAGLGAEEAISQALDLTESINQAVQVSGAGAQASDAALRQLIQGLQGGALRGDEFNSVMEQSPRLAKALADGLGVTTGQLRAMANEGRLTSDVVISALKSQADTLKAEFSTLPPTVGRAVQNLSTAWTVYIGEADKATGASKTAAQAINLLAENLDTVAGYLLDAGQAAAAFTALKLAQTFLGIGAAARTSATSIAANTAAMTAANAASAGAAAGVGRFAAILGGLRTFTLLGIVTNIQDIGTWLGEAAAKAMGYRDRTDELAQAERSRAAAAEEGRQILEAQLAANKAAIDAQFELSTAASASIAAFDDLAKSGKSANEAISEIGKDFDLATQPGIANAAAVLDKLQADGKISAAQFEAAWAEALKGVDLLEFEVKAKAALAGAARESERVAAVMDASLREAIRRSGADFDVLSGGMSRAARSAINDTDTIIAGLDRLKEDGVDTGRALEASLSKAISTADSQAALDALKSRIEQVREVLGDRVANSLLSQIEDQAAKAAGALGGLDSALKKLGITSDAELKKAATDTRALYDEVVKAGGSAREQAEAFEKMANAAIASGDGAALSYAKAQAAARGFEISTDAGGKTIVRSLKEAAEAAQEAGSSVGGLAGSIDAASAAAQRYVGWADRMAQRNKTVGSEEAAAAERKRLGVDKEGFTLDKNGSRLAMGGDLTTLTGIKNFLQQAGLDEEQAKRVAVEFSDGRGNIPYFSNPGQKKYGGEFSTISDALLKAAERTTFGMGGSGGQAIGGSTTHNVNVSVGGKRRSFNAASADDAASAAAVFKDIEAAANRSR